MIMDILDCMSIETADLIKDEIEEILIDYNITNKYKLQYIPNSMLSLKYQHFKYKEKNINRFYLYSLINNIIMSYYRLRENEMVLNAVVLRKKLGRNYTAYIDYLVDNKIIEKIKNYRAGKISRTYKLCDNIINNKEIKRVKNYTTVKELIEPIFITQDSNSTLIKEDVKKRLISDLFDIDLNHYKATVSLLISSDFYEEYSEKQTLSGYDQYNWSLGNINKIMNKEIYYKIDDYGRLHSNFTNINSDIRKNSLSINREPIIEFDIPNSQPMFLLKSIKNHMSKYIIDTIEYNKLKDLVINATLYEVLGRMWDIKSKKLIKKQLFAILYGDTLTIKHKNVKMFKEMFPTIFKFIRDYKKANKNYKIIAHELQRLESDFIYNHVIDHIYSEIEDIKLFTVHDCVAVPITYEKEVRLIFDYYLNKLKKSLEI